MSPFFTFSKVKFPSIPVTLPLVVPFTTTDAPATGPKASFTIPDTFSFCWEVFVSCLNGLVSANALWGGEKAKAPENMSKLTNLVLFNIDDIFNSYYPAKVDKIVLKN